MNSYRLLAEFIINELIFVAWIVLWLRDQRSLSFIFMVCATVLYMIFNSDDSENAIVRIVTVASLYTMALASAEHIKEALRF